MCMQVFRVEKDLARCKMYGDYCLCNNIHFLCIGPHLKVDFLCVQLLDHVRYGHNPIIAGLLDQEEMEGGVIGGIKDSINTSQKKCTQKLNELFVSLHWLLLTQSSSPWRLLSQPLMECHLHASNHSSGPMVHSAYGQQVNEAW